MLSRFALLVFSDGAGKSGMFCALCYVINRMTYDREVDVYMAVRHVQSVTPQAVTSVVRHGRQSLTIVAVTQPCVSYSLTPGLIH